MLGTLQSTLRFVGFLALTLPLMPVQGFLLLCQSRFSRQLPHIYHRALCKLLRFKIKTEGNVPAAGPCLLVANHVSWIDIVILSAVAPVSFVAKREVAQWLLFGSMAKLQRSVFIDRDKRSSTASSNTELQRRLANGETVVLFPEGTSGDGASVRTFKSSFFAAAQVSGTIVTPVTIVYRSNWHMPMTRRQRPHFAWYGDMDLVPHLWRVLAAGPLHVEVIFHAPLEQHVLNDRKQAAQQAETLVREGLANALHASSNFR